MELNLDVQANVMGSDQSSQHGQSRLRGKNPKRSQSAGNNSNSGGHRDDRVVGNTSPRPSICSDSDIPYISYATARPISEGESALFKN